MSDSKRPWLMVLGTAQDGGVPQTGCTKPCCDWARAKPERTRLPACLALIDPAQKMRWLMDCTPDFPKQLAQLNEVSDPSWGLGIFLTHAHIGHYVGLIHLGREVMNCDALPVYCMPKMAHFLRSDAPWNLLVEQGHIELHELTHEHTVPLSDELSITPLNVPHRGEISETVCFEIKSSNKTALHLPDIDNWEDWTTDLATKIKEVDVAWIDGTFFDAQEIQHRDLGVIPHPRITDSLARLANLPNEDRQKVRFTHLNHTNPACDLSSAAHKQINETGAQVASEGEIFNL